MSLGRSFGSPFKKANKQIGRFNSLQHGGHRITSDENTSTPSRKAKSEEKSTAASKKKTQLINELFETERTYHRNLTLLKNLFLDPLRQNGVLSVKAIEHIFANIEAIQTINIQLLSSMETLGVAKAFQEMAPFMKLYSVYANNYENATKVIQENEKKCPAFLKFKQQQEGLPEMNGLKLLALLITPIQRVPRYKLLLENLLKNSKKHEPDYDILKEACHQIRCLATHINECVRQQENFQKMLEIQNQLTGDGVPRILTPGRIFLREGTLLKVCKRGGSKERMIYLFNDIIICAKRDTSSSFSFRQAMPLVDCVIEQLMGNLSSGSSSNNINGMHGGLFKIICKGKTLLLFSNSQQDTTIWIDAIKDAIGELHANLSSLERSEHESERALHLRNREIKIRPGTRIRRSRVIVEKKNTNLLTPLKNAVCPSPLPTKDSLYPMRWNTVGDEDDNSRNNVKAEEKGVTPNCFRNKNVRKATMYEKENKHLKRQRPLSTQSDNTSVDDDSLKMSKSNTQVFQIPPTVSRTQSVFNIPKSVSCLESFESGYCNAFNFEQLASSKTATQEIPVEPPSCKKQRMNSNNSNDRPTTSSVIARSIRKARRSRKSKSASDVRSSQDFTSWYYSSNK